jgi:hypothetical protein
LCTGSYIVTCDFNKNITLIDFFSGEVMFHLSGHHSELITGLKFCLDGSSLMSIGGDGCIMVWKTSYGLVRSMKDRLIELFSKAQKRNSKVMTRQGALSSASFTASVATHQSHLPSSPPSHKSAASSSSAGSSVFPPPPPSPSPSPSDRAVQSSLSSLKMKLSSKQQQQQQSHHNLNDSSSSIPPPPPPSTGFDKSNISALSSSVASTSSTTNSKKNRWQENLQKESKGGYELFGKKVHAKTEETTDGKHRNKFTLELTGSVLPGEKTMKPVNKENEKDTEEEQEKLLEEEEPKERTSSVGIEEDDQGIRSSASAAAMLNESSSSIKAQHHEDKDDVNLPSSSDEDEDVEKFFKSLDEYESDFDVVSPSSSPSKVAKQQLKVGDDGLPKDQSLTLSRSPSTLGISSGINSFHEEEKDLNAAQSNIDHLEKSANDLESWLEDMVSFIVVVLWLLFC